MTWNLYLDDVRNPGDTWKNPEEWTVARSSGQAKTLVISRGWPKKMSLDHDLGGEDTSMVFLKWLANESLDFDVQEFPPLPEWHVHSANPVGAKNIAAFMNSWEKVAGEDI